jgi:hypothetical protein
MKIIELSRNIHKVDILYNFNSTHQVMFLSDIHFDNPHCKRDLLKKHLDYALELNIPVFINGDFFCVMQGKYDPRRRKSNILPQHNVDNYIDAVINEAVEWFKPYAKILKLVGYGNHETGVLKNIETDVLQRFVDLFNSQNGGDCYTGGYGGWLIFNFKHKAGGASANYKVKYFHGSGGGGPVTKGTIQLNRMMAQVQGADCIWQGHVHELYSLYYTIETLNRTNKVILKDILHLRTSSYKEEYGDGYMDFHIERGRPPKPLGGYILTLSTLREEGHTKIKATPTPIN